MADVEARVRSVVEASLAEPTALALALLALSGCERRPAGQPGDSAQERPHARVEVTVLFANDEHGWLLAHDEKGRTLGGAAEVLGQWVRDEGHCPGPAMRERGGDGGAGERLPGPPCPDPRTLLLSGGDNFTGPAISSYFDGRPMAEAMARMGYAASAFGNHEFDFGRARFVEDRAVSGAGGRVSGAGADAAGISAATGRMSGASASPHVAAGTARTASRASGSAAMRAMFAG